MARRHRLIVLVTAVLPAACVESRPPRPPVRVAVYAALLSLDPHLESELVPLVFPHDLYVLRQDVAWTPRLDGRVLAAELAREPARRP